MAGNKSGVKKWIFRALALFFGLLALVLMMELGLRIAGRFVTKPVIESNPAPRPPGKTTFEILTVGDSHTYGKGAPKGYSYPEQLQRILTKAKADVSWVVDNKGIPGHNSSQALSIMRARLSAPPPPDLVLACAGTNNDHNLAQATFLPDQLQDNAPGLQWAYLFRNSRTYRLGQITVRRVRQLTENNKEVPEVLYDEVIDENEKFLVEWLKDDFTAMNEACADSGCGFALIGYAANVPPAARAMSEMKIDGVPFLDNYGVKMSAMMKRMGYMAPDGHPNKEGYALIASRVARYLAENSLVPVAVEEVDKALEELGF